MPANVEGRKWPPLLENELSAVNMNELRGNIAYVVEEEIQVKEALPSQSTRARQADGGGGTPKSDVSTLKVLFVRVDFVVRCLRVPWSLLTSKPLDRVRSTIHRQL